MRSGARNYRDTVFGDVGLACEEPSLAVQASKDECDINFIVKKYLRTGILPEVQQGAYLDISDMVDLRGAIEMVRDAEAAFMDLPAEIRRRFDNDPTKLVEFAQDDKNMAEAVKLGLVDAKALTPSQPPQETPPKAEVPNNTST